MGIHKPEFIQWKPNISIREGAYFNILIKVIAHEQGVFSEAEYRLANRMHLI